MNKKYLALGSVAGLTPDPGMYQLANLYLVPRPDIQPGSSAAAKISGHTSLLNQHYCTIK